MSAAQKFEVAYKLKDFAEIVKKEVHEIRFLIENRGLPSYKEGKYITLKLSDYEKWREQRKRSK